MKKGYDIFGKAYGVMMRNDLHDINSIDHKFMQEMILLDDESRAFLYDNKPKRERIYDIIIRTGDQTYVLSCIKCSGY